MKRMLMFFLVLVFVSSCSIIRQAKQPEAPVSSVVQENAELPPLKLAESYVVFGKRAEQMKDTLGAEYYFGKAMEIANDFRQGKETLPDSTSQSMLENVSLEYARYLARLNGVEHDTLSAANVLETLSNMEDSLGTAGNDSSLVDIPDIIEDEQVLAIPLVLNQKVENVIKYFQGKGRRVFTKWLQRSGWYRDMITRILKEEGVPEELLYLAMIESGFNPFAHSYARAVGMWQFIYSTGRAYGLHSSWWFDERKDPEKATRAAARHLKDLYQRFNNWYLAIAGYNFSPRKIEKRIEHYKVDEFWELPRLPRQTRNYVPTFIAAALMSKEPEKYGFFVDQEPPIGYDTVTVRECVDLNVVASCVDTTFDYLKKLNPALLRWCTPPDRNFWVLNIPEGKRAKFIEEYAKVPQGEKMTWLHHRIRSGETLSTIAHRYGVNVSEIKRFNNIRGSLIRAGHSIVIPVPQNKKYLAHVSRETPAQNYSPRRTVVKDVPGRTKNVHVVQKGETLWDIASEHGVTISQIRRWNGLGSYSRIIHPGQEINVWLPEGSDLLASQVGPQPEKDVDDASAPSGANDGQTIIYSVKNGDTLWDIAMRYGVSIRDIKRWNNRRSNTIKPGEQLKIVRTN